MSDNNDEVIAEDRGTISDGRYHEANKKPTKIIVGIAFAGFCAYILWSILSTPSTSDDEIELTRPQEVRNFNFSPAPLELAPPAPPEIVETPEPPAPPLPIPIEPIVLPQLPTVPDKVEKVDPLFDAARRAPVLAFSNNYKAQPSNAEKSNFVKNETSKQEQQGLSDRLKAIQIEGTKAGLLGNRNFIIAMGTSIPCVLETAMSSDQPGFTSCIVNRDILSDNGRVVLLDKGTQIVGEYQGGIKQGQSRLFVLWTRAKTPNGVIVDLASPSTDSLGRAGFDGTINNHWWERFGSAFLLSNVNDFELTPLDFAGGIDGDFLINDINTSGNEAAKIALEHQIDIPPTLEKRQGELVNIFVARDLDFSSVYKLSVTDKKTNVFKHVDQSNSLIYFPVRQK